MNLNPSIWLKVIGLTTGDEPRGVRAEFCEYCLTIAPHWVYDSPAELNRASDGGRKRSATDSFQLCRICSARTSLPPAAILASRRVAEELDIEKLIQRTNPALWEQEAIERISTMLNVIENRESRRQFAISAFAYSQQDQIEDITRVASIRVIGLLLAMLPICGKLFQRAPLLVATTLSAVIPLAAAYRFVVVPLRIRHRLFPAWIRLLTGANVAFGELQQFLVGHAQRFPQVAALIRSRMFRRLGDDGLLHRNAAALRPGIDYLPPPRSKV